MDFLLDQGNRVFQSRYKYLFWRISLRFIVVELAAGGSAINVSTISCFNSLEEVTKREDHTAKGLHDYVINRLEYQTQKFWTLQYTAFLLSASNLPGQALTIYEIGQHYSSCIYNITKRKICFILANIQAFD